MAHEFLSLTELAARLGRDRREIEKLVQRGRIPGHKAEGEWRFHPAEIQHWLEQEMRGYTPDELALVEDMQGETEGDADVPVSSLLSPETVQVPLEARTKRSVLENLLEVAGRTWHVWEPATVLQTILEREAAFTTAFANGVAIPHPRNPLPQALGESVVAYGRTAGGIPFGGPHRTLSDIFFLVLCRDSKTHLRVLARLGRLMQQPGFLDALRAAEDNPTSYAVICDFDRLVAGQS